MLYFRLLDLLGLVGVAGHAKLFGIGLRQHHFAVFGRLHGRCRTVRQQKADAVNLAISFGASDWCGSWHSGSRLCRTVGSGAPSAGPHPSDHGSRYRAPGPPSSDGSRFSGVRSAPVLCVTWQVSQPSRARRDGCLFPEHSMPVVMAAEAEIDPSCRRGRLQQLILVVALCADRGISGNRGPPEDAPCL